MRFSTDIACLGTVEGPVTELARKEPGVDAADNSQCSHLNFCSHVGKCAGVFFTQTWSASGNKIQLYICLNLFCF